MLTLPRRRLLAVTVLACGNHGNPSWALAGPNTAADAAGWPKKQPIPVGPDPVLQDIRESVQDLDRGRGSEKLLNLEDERLFACRESAGSSDYSFERAHAQPILALLLCGICWFHLCNVFLSYPVVAGPALSFHRMLFLLAATRRTGRLQWEARERSPRSAHSYVVRGRHHHLEGSYYSIQLATTVLVTSRAFRGQSSGVRPASAVPLWSSDTLLYSRRAHACTTCTQQTCTC